MNIVFLDIDGPMIPYVITKYHPDNYTAYPGKTKISPDYWKFCERAAILWNKLCETRDFQVVISSSWRIRDSGPHYFEDLFETNNLKINLHEDWRTKSLAANNSYAYYHSYEVECTRAAEINEWILRHNEIKNFIILDDSDSGETLISLKPEHMYMEDRIILIDPDTGLSSNNIRNILSKTQGWLK